MEAPTLEREWALWAEGHEVVAGIDEVGRGPLAGPVIAAAVVFLPGQLPIEGLRDSKLLTPQQRERRAAEVKSQALAWAVGAASVKEIDKLNIRRATALAMRRALAHIPFLPDHVLIDGNPVPELGTPHGARRVWSHGAPQKDVLTGGAGEVVLGCCFSLYLFDHLHSMLRQQPHRPLYPKEPVMSEDPKKDKQSVSVSRRGFVTHTAAAGAGGLLTNLLDGRTEDLHAAPTASANPVPTRPFGRTGAAISIVGFGAGSRFYTSTPDDETGAELIRAAVDRGITFVETGSNYGGDEGISERRIGLAMTTHREKAFLETKVDERDYDGAMREMERSLVRMNTDYLDLVLHHFLLSTDEVAEVAGPNGAEKAIRSMVDQGVVRSRGLSTHTPEVAMASLEQLDPEAIQLPINAVRVPDFEPQVIPAADARGVSIIAMKTCGNGYFFPANATRPDRIEEYGPPPGAWDRWDLPTWTDYIHYVLSLPITAATIGIDSYFTLEGIVAAAASFEPLSAERKASINERAQIFSGTGYWIPQDRRDRGEE